MSRGVKFSRNGAITSSLSTGRALVVRPFFLGFVYDFSDLFCVFLFCRVDDASFLF